MKKRDGRGETGCGVVGEGLGGGNKGIPDIQYVCRVTRQQVVFFLTQRHVMRHVFAFVSLAR